MPSPLPNLLRIIMITFLVHSTLPFTSPRIHFPSSRLFLLTSSSRSCYNPSKSTQKQTRLRSSKTDTDYISDAVSLASTPPFGTTFPNPPVGCVIVSKDGKVLGEGFHPMAGYPHAEVFALLEASGKVDSGRLAASGVMIEQGEGGGGRRGRIHHDRGT